MGLLSELPTSPLTQKGWPWIEETPDLTDGMPNGQPWPKISIVTPSYNQGEFIEETIRSVLLQNYPNLEYIIIDGGSTDDTISVIKKYEKWISYWVSEPDIGQSHAINKGMEITNGEIVGWLNSDDLFLVNGINNILSAFFSNQNAVVWAGDCKFVDKNRQFLKNSIAKIDNNMPLAFCDWGNSGVLAQPACLFKRDAYMKIGGLKQYLHYAMDVDLWIQLSKIGEFAKIDKNVAEVRVYPEAKTYNGSPFGILEIVLINIREGRQDIAEKWIFNKLIRRLFFSLDTKMFIILVSTWVYRKLIKQPFFNALDLVLLSKKIK